MALLKRGFLPIVTLGATILLSGCFSNEEIPQQNSKNNLTTDEMVKIFDEKNTKKEFTTYKELIDSKNNVVAIYKNEKIKSGDLEKRIINTSNYDYVSYILKTMVFAAIEGTSAEPTEKDLEKLQKTLDSISRIENKTVDQNYEKEVMTLSIVQKNELKSLWKEIDSYKKVMNEGKEVSILDLEKFYNSDAIDKGLYADLDATFNEVTLKYYQSALIGLGSEFNIKLLDEGNFTFSKDFTFMDEVLEIYLSNDSETLHKIEALGIDFTGLNNAINLTPIFYYNNSPYYTLGDIKETAIKGALGEAFIDEVFFRYILDEYYSEEDFEALYQAIGNESQVYYFDEEYQTTLKTFVALMNAAKENQIVTDEEIQLYYEKNKSNFEDTLLNELGNFEVNAPILYSSYFNNDGADDYKRLKITLFTKAKYESFSPIIQNEIKSYASNL